MKIAQLLILGLASVEAVRVQNKAPVTKRPTVIDLLTLRTKECPSEEVLFATAEFLVACADSHGSIEGGNGQAEYGELKKCIEQDLSGEPLSHDEQMELADAMGKIDCNKSGGIDKYEIANALRNTNCDPDVELDPLKFCA